jgi:hypothetical protein
MQLPIKLKSAFMKCEDEELKALFNATYSALLEIGLRSEYHEADYIPWHHPIGVLFVFLYFGIRKGVIIKIRCDSIPSNYFDIPLPSKGGFLDKKNWPKAKTKAYSIKNISDLNEVLAVIIRVMKYKPDWRAK